jgi:hypothetical protein
MHLAMVDKMDELDSMDEMDSYQRTFTGYRTRFGFEPDRLSGQSDQSSPLSRCTISPDFIEKEKRKSRTSFTNS